MKQKKIKKRIKEFNDKLTVKQVNTITTVFIILYNIILCILFLYNYEYIVKISTQKYDCPIWFVWMEFLCIVLLCGSIFIGIMIQLYFNVDYKEIIEKQKELELTVPEKYHLELNKFVQVYFNPNKSYFNHSDDYEDLIKTEKELNVKYYAKLTENKEIIVVKKVNEKIIGEPIVIGNYIYFVNHYDPKE